MKLQRFTNLICTSALSLLVSPAACLGAGCLQVGDIVGDSTIVGHEGWSDILSYSISVQNAGWLPGGGASPASISDMFVTKKLDRGSPYYFGSVFAGAPYETARIEVVQDSQPTDDYVQWLFEDAVISAYNTAFDSTSQQPLELLAIDFRQLTYKYTWQGEREPITAGFIYDRSINALTWFDEAPTAGFALVTQFAATAPEPASGMLMLASLVLGPRRLRRARLCVVRSEF
jgi:type VI protein secretion system component Hcp